MDFLWEYVRGLGGMKGALTRPQMVKLHPLGTNEVGGEKIGLVGDFKASGASKKNSR